MSKADVLNQSKKLAITALGVLSFGALLFPTNSVAQLTPIPMYLPGGVVRVYPRLQSRFRRPPSPELPLPVFPGDTPPLPMPLPGQSPPWHWQTPEDLANQVVSHRALTPQSAPPNTCQLKLEATVAMTPTASGDYTVPVDIGGNLYPMIVDSGAESTSLVPDIADAWHLAVDTTRASESTGAGGSISDDYPRILPSLKFGTSEWIDLHVQTFAVAAPASVSQSSPPIGILGANVLSRYDAEFDFPGRTLSLYTATGCLGQFVPWHGAYEAYPADKMGRNRFIADVSLNGHPVRAIVDTGADASLVTSSAAEDAGVDAVALAHDPQLTGSGAGGVPVISHRHTFTMILGKRIYRNAPLLVANEHFRDNDMLLGMDFMRSRRVWLSYSSGWVFMQTAKEEEQAPSGTTDTHLSFTHAFHGAAGTMHEHTAPMSAPPL